MAFTAVPNAGAKLRASVLASLITEVRPVSAKMSTTQALATSSTTLQDVTDLAASVTSDAKYEGLLVFACNLSSGSTEDVKVGFSFPTGAALSFGGVGPSTGVTGTAGDGEFIYQATATSGTTTIAYGVLSSRTVAVVSFFLDTAATPGTLQVMAAQNTSGANTVTVSSASRLILWRVD